MQVVSVARFPRELPSFCSSQRRFLFSPPGIALSLWLAGRILVGDGSLAPAKPSPTHPSCRCWTWYANPTIAVQADNPALAPTLEKTCGLCALNLKQFLTKTHDLASPRIFEF